MCPGDASLRVLHANVDEWIPLRGRHITTRNDTRLVSYTRIVILVYITLQTLEQYMNQLTLCNLSTRDHPHYPLSSTERLRYREARCRCRLSIAAQSSGPVHRRHCPRQANIHHSKLRPMSTHV